MLRYELLLWLGVLGGAITLTTNVQAVIRLSTFFQWLITNWVFLLQYLWQALLLFKVKISAYDAVLLTTCLLLTSGLFYSSLDRPITSKRTSLVALLAGLSVIFSISIFGILDTTAKLKAKAGTQFAATIKKVVFRTPECKGFLNVVLQGDIRNFDRYLTHTILIYPAKR